MKLSSTERILIIVLGVSLVIAYGRTLLSSQPGQAGGRIDVESGSSRISGGETGRTASTPPRAADVRRVQQARTVSLAWGRDPFGSGTLESELALTGILWDPAHPLAIINGQTVSVGDEVEGYQVIEIFGDRVTLSDGSQAFQLILSP